MSFVFYFIGNSGDFAGELFAFCIGNQNFGSMFTRIAKSIKYLTTEFYLLPYKAIENIYMNCRTIIVRLADQVVDTGFKLEQFCFHNRNMRGIIGRDRITHPVLECDYFFFQFLKLITRFPFIEKFLIFIDKVVYIF